MSLLPGLYLALLALLLAWALRRWWDPVPLRVWAVFGAVLLLLLAPVLFGGKVLLPLDILAGISPEGGARPARVQGNPLQSDLVTQVVPTLTQVRRALAAGEWPLWNELAGAGVPLMADPQAQVLQPLVVLGLPLPLEQAVGVTAGLRVLLPLVFFFLLLRRQGASEIPATFGSVSYGLCGFLLLWLGWPLANSAALLPAVLYAIAMVDERGARRDLLLLALTAAAALTAGHPETILYIGTVGALFAGARLLARPAGERGRLVGRCALAGAIALGLAAPALLPVIRYLPQTHRDRMVEIRNERLKEEPFLLEWTVPGARREALERVARRVTPVFAPHAFGDRRAYWGSRNLNEDASGFAGTAALLAALAAFVPGARRLRQERLFLGLAAVSLAVLALPPGLPRLLMALPPFDRSPTFHQRIALILAFSVAFLAACTAERWRRGEGRRAVLIVCGLILGGLVVWGYQAWPPPAGMAGEAARVVFSARVLQLIVLLLAAGAFLVPWGKAKVVLPMVAVAELFLFYGSANPALPRTWFYPETPALAFLRENAGDSRVAAVGGLLRPNALAVYGLADARVSNPMKPYLYTEALAPVSRSVRDIADMMTRAEHPVYQLLGVRYVVTRPGQGGRRGQSLRPVFRDGRTIVLQRRRVLPRLFLPAAAEMSDETDWSAWLARNRSFANRALVRSPPGRSGRWSAASPDGSKLDLLSLRPAHLVASGSLAEDRLLASSVYQDGGWRLLVDRRPRETVLANGPFVAAWLPAGEQRVDLLYRPPAFVAGMALAALALAAAIVVSTPLP
ncbi:MAG TPA: hypothetical protein VE685_19470 [Thermoanaerobaculia bacterium]|nr:hypothetical protein [Thermoanaerobaculia bacterium]